MEPLNWLKQQLRGTCNCELYAFRSQGRHYVVAGHLYATQLDLPSLLRLVDLYMARMGEAHFDLTLTNESDRSSLHIGPIEFRAAWKQIEDWLPRARL